MVQGPPGSQVNLDKIKWMEEMDKPPPPFPPGAMNAQGVLGGQLDTTVLESSLKTWVEP